MKFEGVKYIQNSGITGQAGQFIVEYSPSVYHCKKNGGESDAHYYIERTKNEEYWKYTKTNDVWTKARTTEKEWEDIEDLYTDLKFDQFIEAVGYEKLEYKDGEYYAEIHQGKTETASDSGKVHLKFMDKKLIVLKTEEFDSDEGKWIVTQDINFAYDEYTPELPEVGPTK
ncbi:MAG: hypothetical protein MJ208_02235 [Bacilli bacterium]|nr:hypothetical protein [Bacilli bacterium]